MHPEYKALTVRTALELAGIVSLVATIVMLFMGIHNAFRAALLVGGLAFCIIGVLVPVDKQEVKRIDTWRELGFGSSRTFPRTDFERLSMRVWAKNALTNLAYEMQHAFKAQKAAERGLHTYTYEPYQHQQCGPASMDFIRGNERKQNKCHSEFVAQKRQADEDVEKAKKGFYDAWDLFKALEIGDGEESIPRNMLPVDPATGDHYPNPEAFRKSIG